MINHFSLNAPRGILCFLTHFNWSNGKYGEGNVLMPLGAFCVF